MRRYPPSTIYRYLDLPSTQIIQTHKSHRHKTTPLFQTLVQAPYPLPTNTTHTSATQTQIHIQHSPCSQRNGKAQTQSSYPLTSFISHFTHSTNPSHPTHHISFGTSAVLDTIPKPRVPLIYCCCCLPTPMTLASGGSPIFPLVVHQPVSPSIWPAVQSLRRGLSTNPGVTMWCVCGCSGRDDVCCVCEC